MLWARRLLAIQALGAIALCRSMVVPISSPSLRPASGSLFPRHRPVHSTRSMGHSVGLKESLRGGGEDARSSATDAVKERHRAIGVCYYPEHWPEEVWEEDARQMADVGIEYVRIGEFMWSVIEPSPGGTFEWGLLDKAIETLANHNLKIVLGTPTACPPKWLVDKHPDILPYGDDGRPRKFGSRRHYSFSSHKFRQFTERICSAMAERYGNHPAVVGWQTDNEYGCHDTIRTYDPSAQREFRVWLKNKYKNVEALNEAWGNRFWAMEYGSFEEVDLPDGTVTEANPIHRLDFARFSSDQVVSYNALQVSCIGQRSPKRFITHNFMMFFYDFDAWTVGQHLSFATFDSYPLGFTDTTLGLSDMFTVEQKLHHAKTGHPDLASLHHDLHRGISRNKRFWIMEQQPGPVNWGGHNPAPAPGMVRLWTWEAFSHGADVVSYFRWRQAPFAQEQMHAGLNKPDYTPDTGLFEAKQVISEVRALEAALAARPDGVWNTGISSQQKAALVLDFEAHWLISTQPQGREFNYPGLVFIFYSALRKLGFDVDIVPPGVPLTGYAVVAVPSLPIVSDDMVQSAKECGCPVIFGPRSGSKTLSFAIPRELPPGQLQALLPVKVTRIESFRAGWKEEVLLSGVPDHSTNKCGTAKHVTGVWKEWMEPVNNEVWSKGLDPQMRAESTAEFSDGSMAALRYKNCHYLGFWPQRDLLVDYISGIFSKDGEGTLKQMPDSLRISRHDGVTIAVNYAGTPQDAPAPDGAEFIMGTKKVAAHGVSAWLSP